MQLVNLGLVGGGTVGGGVWTALARNGALMAALLGVELQVVRVAVCDLKKTRPIPFPEAIVTDDWHSVVKDPSANVVLELMGGTTTAREVVLEALRLGKPVVTANKALLSRFGEELFAASARH